MTKRLTIVLEDADADLLLRLAGSPRKQSQVLTRLIRAAATRQPAAGPDWDSLRLHMIGLSSELQTVARSIAERDSLVLNPADDLEALATTALASESALAGNWLGPEEDEAWRDL